MSRKVLRVLLIEGDDDFVERTLAQSYIQPEAPVELSKGPGTFGRIEEVVRKDIPLDRQSEILLAKLKNLIWEII